LDDFSGKDFSLRHESAVVEVSTPAYRGRRDPGTMVIDPANDIMSRELMILHIKNAKKAITIAAIELEKCVPSN